MSTKTVRLAGTQGFYGDSPAGALMVAMARGADYLVHDALAELTLSILQKDRQRDPSMGFARDIEWMAGNLMPLVFKQGMKMVTNSGGLNPDSAAAKVIDRLREKGVQDVKVATITGDDLLARIPELQQKGESLVHLENESAFDPGEFPLTHANVYIGAKAVKEALDRGADLILAGRVADPCLTLGILAHEHGWDLHPQNERGLDLLASGILIGHLLECGGQASGGNSYAEWPMDYPVSNLGYPIAEVFEDGLAEFSILDGQGGKMSRNTLREQLLYEIHDPANYITPDVIADFTEVTMTDTAPNRVQVQGARGKPRPEKLKLAIGRQEGYLSDQFFFFSWPYAYEKAQKFIQAVKEIWNRSPVKIERMDFRLVGINGIHGDEAPLPDQKWLDQMNEIGIRVVIQHRKKEHGRLAFHAITCLGLNGPPGIVAAPGWGHMGRAQLGLWPTLIDRKHVDPKVEIHQV